jgi:hypothetical protein
LDVMVARRGEVRSKLMASVLEDAERLVAGETLLTPAEGNDPSVTPLVLRRVDKSKASADPESSKRVKGGGGIALLGKRARAPEGEYGLKAVTYSFADNQYANMRLRDCPFTLQGYNARWDGTTVIDISDLPDDPMAIKSGRLGEYVVFGCLVKKVDKRRSSDGRKYAVWTLSNMVAAREDRIKNRKTARNAKRFTSINCLVFDDAFEKFHTQVEGAAFAFRKPTILPPKASRKEMTGDASGKKSSTPSPGDIVAWSGVCLKVSRRNDVVPVGVCRDYALCGKTVAGGTECGAWYHKRYGTECPHHSRERYRKCQQSVRMDINNQERPGLSKSDLYGTRGPVNVTHGNDLQADFSGADFNLHPTTDSRGRDEFTRVKEKNDIARIQASSKAAQAAVRIEKQRTAGDVATKPTKLTLAEHRGKDVARRIAASPSHGIEVLRGGISCGLVKRHAEQVAVGAQMKKLSSNCSDVYREAVDSLLKLGFTLDARGGFDPPSTVTAKRLGIVLRKKLAGNAVSRRAFARPPRFNLNAVAAVVNLAAGAVALAPARSLDSMLDSSADPVPDVETTTKSACDRLAAVVPAASAPAAEEAELHKDHLGDDGTDEINMSDIDVKAGGVVMTTTSCSVDIVARAKDDLELELYDDSDSD